MTLWGCGYFLGLFYATNPKFRRYSKGLIAPSDILIRFSLYQCRYSSRIVITKASVRAIVEHPFQSIKNVFGYDKVRYRGLAKNESRLYTLFASANLLMMGRKLVPAPI